MAFIWSLLLVSLIGCGHGSFYLKHLSYTKLPATFTAPSTKTYKMFAGTAEEAAYDPKHKMIYVVGEDSHLLHVLDITDPLNPVQAFTHKFDAGIHGKPRDVAVCGDEVAVSLSSPIKDVHEGHVMFFNTMAKGDNSLVELQTSKVPVGAMPDMLTYTPNCASILVADEGRPGKLFNGAFTDPEASLHIISSERTGAPSVKFVGFMGYNSRHDIRVPGKFTTNAQYHPTVAQGLEPEYIAVSPDGKYAYITLQENNAVATMSISSGVISEVHSLEKKEWRDLGIDSTNMDGGVHLRKYPYHSLRQPDVAKVLTVGRKNYLITVDEGAKTSFTSSLHGFNWNDYSRTDTLRSQNLFDEVAINNASFYADLAVDSKAGYLTVSIIDDIDIYSPNNNKLGGVTHFGGRGFSIWDTSDFSLVWDSKDEIEEKMDILLHNVFNTDCPPSRIRYDSPEINRDYVSGEQGPKLNAMDIIEENGRNILLVGSETVGALFLYTINTTTGLPVPKFESAHRQGETDYLWNSMYDQGTVGDVDISAIGLIPASQTDPSFNKTLAYVVGAASGSVSLYEVVEHVDPDNIFG